MTGLGGYGGSAATPRPLKHNASKSHPELATSILATDFSTLIVHLCLLNSLGNDLEFVMEQYYVQTTGLRCGVRCTHVLAGKLTSVAFWFGAILSAEYARVCIGNRINATAAKTTDVIERTFIVFIP
jgi:hypothetical protein